MAQLFDLKLLFLPIFDKVSRRPDSMHFCSSVAQYWRTSLRSWNLIARFILKRPHCTVQWGLFMGNGCQK